MATQAYSIKMPHDLGVVRFLPPHSGELPVNSLSFERRCTASRLIREYLLDMQRRTWPGWESWESVAGKHLIQDRDHLAALLRGIQIPPRRRQILLFRIRAAIEAHPDSAIRGRAKRTLGNLVQIVEAYEKIRLAGFLGTLLRIPSIQDAGVLAYRSSADTLGKAMVLADALDLVERARTKRPTDPMLRLRLQAEGKPAPPIRLDCNFTVLSPMLAAEEQDGEIGEAIQIERGFSVDRYATYRGINREENRRRLRIGPTLIPRAPRSSIIVLTDENQRRHLDIAYRERLGLSMGDCGSPFFRRVSSAEERSNPDLETPLYDPFPQISIDHGSPPDNYIASQFLPGIQQRLKFNCARNHNSTPRRITKLQV